MNGNSRVMTGITPSGSPHLGNYVGAIRPAIAAMPAGRIKSQLAGKKDVSSFYFISDYHALTVYRESFRTQQSILEVAATWLACGLDPERVHFYRQSSIPEIPELLWMLACVAPKGMLNRSHAYKAAKDNQRSKGEPIEAIHDGITAGLYLYPVLMAADILLFKIEDVIVGQDQVQHIEMARNMARRWNRLYQGDYFKTPRESFPENSPTLRGLDGRKMSKSYDNTIPMWLPKNELREAIFSIVTNSQPRHEQKDTEATIFNIYRVFADNNECAEMRKAFEEGIGWGDAKQKLFELVDRKIAPMRDSYEEWMSKPQSIRDILIEGAEIPRQLAKERITLLRECVGISSR